MMKLKNNPGAAVLMVLCSGALLICLGISRARDEGSASYVIPIEDLYSLSGLAVPTGRICLVSEDYCRSVQVDAANLEIPPFGIGISEQKVIQKLTEPGSIRSSDDLGLIKLTPDQFRNPSPDNVLYFDSYVGQIFPDGVVEINNLVRFSCSFRNKHCLADLGPLQDIGANKSHIIFAFDRGRLQDWRTITQAVVKCVKLKCRQFKIAQ